jgi:hypothetical protein
MLKIIHNKYFYILITLFVVLILAFFVLPHVLPAKIVQITPDDLTVVSSLILPVEEKKEPVKKIASHVALPEAVKAIYMSACVAATPSFREKLVKLARETEINSIMIDVKDYTGTVSFYTEHPLFKDNNGTGCKVRDMAEFVEYLHENNIYAIARITAFQDPYLAKLHPEWAVKKNSDKTATWKDGKGLAFLDPGNEEVWHYLVELGKESYNIGFDEINYDYIRFPSDGNMKDIYFPASNEILVNNIARPAIGTSTPAVKSGKSIVMRSFFKYVYENFKDTGIVTSADLFGMTATNYDDLNIGQILEDAAPNFDFIAPMVYPSHYPVGFLNYKSVAEVNANGYEIVNYSMKIAAERLVAIGESPLKLRPWLQDNDYPVHYTPAMVREQIQATYDAGLTSWMLCDAGNTYTQSALFVE